MPDESRTLKIAIPKGSLEGPTIELLSKAGYEVYVSSRGLRPASNDPELDGSESDRCRHMPSWTFT